VMKSYPILLLAAVIVLGWPRPSSAIINGKEDFEYNAVVELDTPKGRCSGVVVSLDPFLVVTTRHCAERTPKDKIALNEFHPTKISVPKIENRFQSYGKDPAQYDKYRQEFTAKDMAILAFPADVNDSLNLSENDLFALEPFHLADADRVYMCGWGTVSMINGRGRNPGIRHCGSNQIVSMKTALSLGPPVEVDTLDALGPNGWLIPSPRFRILATSQAWLDAFPWLKSKSREKTESIPNAGDSGGPVFVKRDGRNILVGSYSAAVLADQKLFHSLDNGENDSEPILGYFLSYEDPTARSFLMGHLPQNQRCSSLINLVQ
jgi:Trypsin-like peptidase domain